MPCSWTSFFLCLLGLALVSSNPIQIVQNLNEQFHAVNLSESPQTLEEVGVIMNVWDYWSHSREDKKSWIWCQRGQTDCPRTTDRISASIASHLSPRTICDSDFLGHTTGFGMILSSINNLVFCAYPTDGASGNVDCHPMGKSSHCVPGCWRGSPPRCDGFYRCPYQPEKIHKMLYENVERNGAVYNEVIFSSAVFMDNLYKPIDQNSVVAIFYQKPFKESAVCEFWEGVKQDTNLLDLPLVKYDSKQKKNPFSLSNICGEQLDSVVDDE